jgi:hypothetical protein
MTAGDGMPREAKNMNMIRTWMCWAAWDPRQTRWAVELSKDFTAKPASA